MFGTERTKSWQSVLILLVGLRDVVNSITYLAAPSGETVNCETFIFLFYSSFWSRQTLYCAFSHNPKFCDWGCRRRPWRWDRIFCNSKHPRFLVESTQSRIGDICGPSSSLKVPWCSVFSPLSRSVLRVLLSYQLSLFFFCGPSTFHQNFP